MKNFKRTIFAAVLAMFVGMSMQAQEKAKDVRKNTDKKIENQMASDDAEHARMVEMFDRARAQAKTDEERTMIDKKQAAYEDMRNNTNHTLERKNAELKKAELEKEKVTISKEDQIKQAYEETSEVEYKLQASNLKIKEARERLEEAKRNQTLSAEEIAEKEAKIKAADEKLRDAKLALERQRKVLIEKHAELESDN